MVKTGVAGVATPATFFHNRTQRNGKKAFVAQWCRLGMTKNTVAGSGCMVWASG
jgi:hypothetical protein